VHRFGFRLVGLALVAYVVASSDWAAVLDTFSHVSVFRVAAITLLFLPIMAVKAWRWEKLLLSQAIRYPLVRIFPVSLYTNALGFLSPGRLGELFKITFVCRETGAAIAPAAVTVVADRVLDLLFLLAVSFLGASVYIWKTGPGAALLFSLVGVALCAGCLMLMVRYGSMKLVAVPEKEGGEAEAGPGGLAGALLRGLGSLLHPRRLAFLGGLTALATLLHFYQNMLFAHQLGLELDIGQVGFALALVSVVSWLPVSVMGIGTREVTLIYSLGIFGVDQAHAVSYSLLIFAVQLVVNLGVAGIGSILMPFNNPSGSGNGGAES